jgi:phosphatidylinositol alpha-1,6-mannosyltransferase
MSTNKLLFIASDYKPKEGGRADYIDNLARGLIGIGCKTKVLAVVQPHQKERLAFLQKYEEWVIPFEVVHDERPGNWLGNKFVSLLEIVRCLSPRARRVVGKTSYFRASADSLSRLEGILAKEKPTMIVFGHLDMRLYPFALLFQERKLPYGILAHGFDFPHFPNRKNDLIRKGSMLRGARWIAANSSYTKSLLEIWGIPDSRIRIVHPPIGEEAIRHAASSEGVHRTGDELSLVTLCRLVEGKGIDLVLRALRILAANGIPYRYVVAGDGVERKLLETLVDELGLRSKVRFVGYITGEDKWSLLRNSDVFVLPSRVEGFGIAFIEAAAFGLPAVGTGETGISDAVIDGETGVLVAPESPEALAEALTFLYRNPKKRMEMGRAGMQRARSQFSPTAIAAHFQQEILENVSDRSTTEPALAGKLLSGSR